jgi:hypothetical protein
MDIENIKPYEDMTDDDRWQAIGSARFILEDVSMEKMAEVSGLPMGVIVAAYRNIFRDVNDVKEPRPKNPTRPRRIKN